MDLKYKSDAEEVAALKAENERLRKALERAKAKLSVYHAQTKAEYSGGEALHFLMDDIDKAISGGKV